MDWLNILLALASGGAVAGVVVGILRGQISALRGEVKYLRDEIGYLRSRVDKAVNGR